MNTEKQSSHHSSAISGQSVDSLRDIEMAQLLKAQEKSLSRVLWMAGIISASAFIWITFLSEPDQETLGCHTDTECEQEEYSRQLQLKRLESEMNLQAFIEGSKLIDQRNKEAELSNKITELSYQIQDLKIQNMNQGTQK